MTAQVPWSVGCFNQNNLPLCFLLYYVLLPIKCSILVREIIDRQCRWMEGDATMAYILILYALLCFMLVVYAAE